MCREMSGEATMDSFLIPSASGTASLEFFERTPTNPGQPIERFKVRLTDQDLSAVGRVYVGPSDTHPAPMFAQMAASWRGWQGEVVWESPEGELVLRASCDRAGHVSLRIELRSGPTEGDWAVRSTI